MHCSHLPLLLGLLALALVSCSSAAAFGKPNGQPGCQTEEEIEVALYPHFYIKNQFWICQTLGVPATIAYCPIATAFLNDAKACVAWVDWYWTPTVAPPSQPIVGDI
ncbi:hypothetical protein KR222_005751 [Zaprionus bogoriensis]|nr:hypothetical protein KR222_005751 [Zaprionus bogoriensis]